MFKYTSQKQLSIFDFHTDFESKLNPQNRWVKMAELLDWDKLASVYAQNFSTKMGAGSIDARIVIGALIIKHIEKRDDRGTIEAIQENPYMQYFLGLDHFIHEPVFDPSLFVYIRKRLGNKSFDAMNQVIISGALKIENQSTDNDINNDNQLSNDTHEPDSSTISQTKKDIPNKGKLQLDATVCDAYIKFPTDLNLLNESREKAEELLDKLVLTFHIKPPRTYRRVARREYLNIAKKKNKSKQLIRKGIRKQLGYLNRDIKYIDHILSKYELAPQIFTAKEIQYLETIKELYRQQEEMYRTRTNSISHRIVSIHQPFIRPIVRGKDGKKVEFGSKINASLMDGFTRINQFDYEAFNESVWMQDQVEEYKNFLGYYPELVQTDDIYMTRVNRAYLKERGIRHTGSPLGRKPQKEVLKRYQKQKLKKEKNQRNQIEGKFGQGKAGYNLNKIMARLADTHESWVASIIFVMNILKAMKDIFVLFFRKLFLCIFIEIIFGKRNCILITTNNIY
jgi:transposase, IS5 family